MMLRIEQITANPFQKQRLQLPNGEIVTMVMNFKPLQLGWFITELTYLDFVIHGLRIVNTPNMLFQWRNEIPFGLGCFSTANREPTFQEDFSSKASILYILTADEVVAYGDLLSGQV